MLVLYTLSGYSTTCLDIDIYNEYSNDEQYLKSIYLSIIFIIKFDILIFLNGTRSSI